MDRQTAINFCRYYDGSDDCPFKDADRAMLWRIEEVWAERMIAGATDSIERAVGEYVAYGLKDFQTRDGVPSSLKAVLLNRFIKYEERINIEGFKEFYLRYYK